MLQEICMLNFVSYFRTKIHTYRSASKIDYRIVIVTRFIDKIKKSENIHQNIYNNFALLLLSVIYGLLYKFYKREDEIKGI